MIEDFSRGYYRTTMDVQFYDDGPAIDRGLYDFIDSELYSREDVPVMMRLGLDAGITFGVKREPAMPRDVLALPNDMADNRGREEVFVLKAEYVDTIGEYYG
jgi:hypothetical protein